MGYFVTDPSLIALANAGLPPDEQVGGYYQMDEHEIARAAARPDLSGRDLTAGRKSNATERPYRANCKHPPRRTDTTLPSIWAMAGLRRRSSDVS